MKKAVLLSIKPRYCELIINGKKTAEVRKTRPKLETPFKCYIYCSKGGNDYNPNNNLWKMDKTGFNWLLNGKVIGEFVCEKIEDYFKWEHDIPALYRHINLFACIDYPELYKFLPDGKGYGWHISNLTIYDMPRLLKDFRSWGADMRGENNEI